MRVAFQRSAFQDSAYQTGAPGGGGRRKPRRMRGIPSVVGPRKRTRPSDDELALLLLLD